MFMEWYEVLNAEAIDSPALLLYPERIQANIQRMIDIVDGDVHRLVPHIKTHKLGEIVRMQLDAGITRFKCATIAELEMALEAGAPWMLIAYQLVGPKVDRFLALQKAYPQAELFSLCDDLGAAIVLAEKHQAAGLTAKVYLDINNGQNRTGRPLEQGTQVLYQKLSRIPGLVIQGLHVYDGHIRNQGFHERKMASDAAFAPVMSLVQDLEQAGYPRPEIITAGSPAFTSASLRPEVFCSPGTTLLWDYGYAHLVEEARMRWAAVLLCRVVSKPAPGLVTVDLGHKAVAAENPLPQRIHFLNLSGYEPVGQSEEHLVLKVDQADRLQVGEILYGIPQHVCPTVALYDQAHIIRRHIWEDTWEITARRRMITC